VFSNSHYRLKLGGALLVIALLGVFAARQGDPINPALWRCVAEPGRWQDSSLWLPHARILSAGDDEFRVESDSVEIRVKGRAPAKVGDRVTLTAIFRSDGPHLEMVRSRPLPPHVRLRWLMEAVSVIVVLGVLANFARHFAFRPKVLQVERAP